MQVSGFRGYISNSLGGGGDIRDCIGCIMDVTKGYARSVDYGSRNLRKVGSAGFR